MNRMVKSRTTLLCADLSKSLFTVTANDYIFKFSSLKNKNKFADRIYDSCDYINNSLSLRWGFTVIENDLGILLAYLKLEHGGCYIKLPDGSEITQWEEISFRGGKIVKNV